METTRYGQELILDLKDCNLPFNRFYIRKFMAELCNLLDMERVRLHFWDYDSAKEKEEAPPHLAGTSAIQFITTSNVTIHTLDKLQAVYINIFTCKTLHKTIIEEPCVDFWGGSIIQSILLERKR